MDNEYFASINEVSKRMSVPAYTLRYWEKQFPTIVRPTTGAGGRRYYRTEVVAKLFVIKELLYSRGMTIAGVKKLIKDGTFPLDIAELNKASFGQVPSAGAAPTADYSKDIDLAINLLEQAKKLLNQ